MKQKVKSYCRNCAALCQMEVTVENGRMTGVAADGSVGPYGAYLCPKGLASIDFHNGAEDRLTQSLRRDASGAFVPVDAWDAISQIGDQIAAIVAEHGPDAVAVYQGTGGYRSTFGNLLQRAFASALGTPHFYSSMTIDQSAKWVTMGRMGIMASGKPRLPDVDLAVLVGNNPIVSHQTFPFTAGDNGAPGRNYEKAKARGMKMILVDPRRTETARYADLLIQPLPGHDAALFAAIARILLRDGTYDRGFCDRFVTQMDELRAAVAPFTPEMVAARADVPIEQIELAAKWIGEAKRPLVGSGSGPSMTAHSNVSDHIIEAVNALVGGYNRAGDVVRNPGALKPRIVREMVAPANRSWEREPKAHSRDIGLLQGEFPTALLPDEITHPGPNKIRALICFGGNPLIAIGDPAKAVPAFDQLELLVCLDARLNETARHAHYVIATSQHFERHDITAGSDGAFPTPFAQYARPVVDKPEGVIDDWEFYWGVARQMRLPLTLKFWGYGMVYAAIPRGMAIDLDTKPHPDDFARFLCGEGHIAFEDLLAHPGGIAPDLPEQTVEPCEDNGARLELMPPDVAEELAAVLADNAPDPRYPFRLTVRRLLETMNSAYLGSKRVKRMYPVNWAYMNPQDMAEAGIEDGMTIELSAEAGTTLAVAKGEDRLRRGVVSMTHLFDQLAPSTDPWSQGGTNIGHLISIDDHVESINHMPRFSAIPIAVRLVAREVAA